MNLEHRLQVKTTSSLIERYLLTQVLVVDVPLLPAKYFRQFSWRDIPVKNKAPIEEGVKAKEILDRMLEREMKVTSNVIVDLISYRCSL